jgi:formate/nitrite transporter FocA (FNT family)
MSSYKTPKDVVVMAVNASLVKTSYSTPRLAVLGFLAGAYISVGGVLMQVVTGGMTSQDDGTKKLVGGAVFPVGLIVVLVAGGELFTGNTAIMIPSFLSRRITIGDVARSVMRVSLEGSCCDTSNDFSCFSTCHIRNCHLATTYARAHIKNSISTETPTIPYHI